VTAAAASPPRFALHGFTGRADAWDHITDGGGATTTGLSLIGHAPGLPVPPGWTFEREVDRIAALLPADPIHLAGYSMGGRVALAVAARFPARVSRLTIVSAHPGLDEARAAARRSADQRWCSLLEDGGIAAFAAAWEDQPMWRSQLALPAEVLEQQRRARLSHDPIQLAAAVRALGLGAMPDLRPRLAGLPMAVDWAAGSLDETYAELARWAAAEIPRGRAIIIPDAGHNLLLERPDQLSRALDGARGEPGFGSRGER